jgi:two-component system sensor histidine kinase SaeS
MKLSVQLLVINLLSVALLIGALMIGYWKMLLTLNQTWMLTEIAIGAGVVSSIAFGLMTIPLTRSIRRLVLFSDRVAHLAFDAQVNTERGPAEVRHLARSLYTMSHRLSESFAQLEGMERTRRELIANISHDLRTPLAAIQSYVEALEDGVVDEKVEMDRYLRTIHNETRRLSRLIDDLFELSKLEAGHQSLGAVPCHLEQVLAEVLDSHQLLLNEKRLTMVVDIPDNLPVLILSPEKIYRVVANLLLNAIRYSPEGGAIELGVTLEFADLVQVSLADHGPGVHPSDQVRLFERFYRSDPSRTRHTGGSGLGLAIARGLVQLHGGEIGVKGRSDASSGAVFWFTLPILDQNVPQLF